MSLRDRLDRVLSEEFDGPNAELLAELDGKWFHAVKNKGIVARKLDSDQVVDTLEGSVEAKAGNWLCKGVAGEPWPQKEEKLLSTYRPVGKLRDGWVKFEPKPDARGVNAAQVDHGFKVEASWGMLSGKAGDYVCQDVDNPADVWIVDRSLFEATYGVA